MSIWCNIFEFIVVVISIYTIIRYRYAIFKNFGGTIYIMFCLFYVFPLLVDLVNEVPKYESDSLIGFRITAHDEVVRIIYCILLFISQIIFIKHLQKVRPSQTITGNKSLNIEKFAIVGMITPIVATIIFANVNYLYAYQWRELDYLPIPDFYSFMERLSYVGISSCALIIFSGNKKIYWIKPIAVLCLLITICIEGKRAILFYSILNFAFLAFYQIFVKSKQSELKTSRLLLMLVLVIIFASYMFSVTITVKIGRGYDENDPQRIIEATRVDFLRDDRVRLALYSEIYPDKWQTLDYYGQTLISNVTNIFPFDIAIYKVCHIKPGETYQFYTTKDVSRTRFGDSETLYYMTPSAFAELVSNFGIILGALLFPFMSVWFMKKVNSSLYPCNFLVCMSYCLLNLFSFTYIVLFLEFTVILCYIEKRKMKRLVKTKRIKTNLALKGNLVKQL